MLFMVGLDNLSREEKIALLAQLNAINSRNVLYEGARRGLKKGKDFVFGVSEFLMGRLSSKWADRVKGVNDQLDWDVNTLQRAIEEEYRQLNTLDDSDLVRHLLVRAARIGGVDPTASKRTISEAVVRRAAGACKIPLIEDMEAVEAAVYRRCMEEKYAQIKEQVDKMTDSQLKELEALLQGQIQGLSKAEQEAIRAMMGLEELSARYMISFVKRTSSIALAQMIVSGFGFGAYLFLTTLIKSISLLLGATFSFGVYATATSALAFLLSSPFLLLAGLIGFGLTYQKAGSALNDELAKLLVLVGRSAFMQSPDP